MHAFGFNTALWIFGNAHFIATPPALTPLHPNTPPLNRPTSCPFRGNTAFWLLHFVAQFRDESSTCFRIQLCSLVFSSVLFRFGALFVLFLFLLLLLVWWVWSNLLAWHKANALWSWSAKVENMKQFLSCRWHQLKICERPKKKRIFCCKYKYSKLISRQHFSFHK